MKELGEGRFMGKDFHRDAGVLGTLKVPLIFGLLRLGSTDRPTKESAISLIHQALDLGVRVLDTADSYCLDDKDFHYGERLAREAVESWHGERDEVKIITKVGMVRPKGKWKPDGSPKHLAKTIEQSLKALDVECLFLVQLHSRDSRVPFEETLGALAELRKAGKMEHIGLCNVSPAEVRQALRHFPVVSVQNELSVLAQSSAKEGMLELTQALGIPFLAHRPLGGYAKVDKLAKNRVLNSLAEKYGVTPQMISLAAVRRSFPHVVPVVGATKSESLQGSVASLSCELSEADWETLTSKYPFCATEEVVAFNAPRVTPDSLPSLEPNRGPGESAEVVLLMGIQGAGKSELVEAYESAGYVRWNRDEEGGSLSDVGGRLKQMLAEGQDRVVLDNTFPTWVSRESIVTISHAHGVPVRCRWLTTGLDEALTNIATRLLERYGTLPGPDEFKELAKSDPNLPPPVALQRYLSVLEPPHIDEGFSVVDTIPFRRRPQPAWTNKGLLLDVDGTLRRTISGELYPRSADDVELIPGRRDVLARWMDSGYRLFFVSNQSGIASGKVSEENVRAAFDRTIELLGLPVQEVCYCSHRAFPVVCFCRKPMPGMGVYLMKKYELSPQSLVMVGDMDSDRKFAEGLSITYHDASSFFADVGAPTPES